MNKTKLMNKLPHIGSTTLLILLLTIIALLPCNIQPVKAESRNIVATYGAGYLEEVNGLLVLHVKGSPYEMGYQNGFMLRDNIQVLAQWYIQQIVDIGFSYEYLVYCSQSMEPYIPQEYIEEMQGLADGAGMNYTDILLMHTIGDTAYYGTGWACSGFAVFGNATVDGHLYHGRNLDYLMYPGEPQGLITVWEPESGNIVVNVGHFGGIGVHTGMNKKGITLEQNFVGTSDKTLDGMPSGFLNRKVLQYSSNLTEAIDIICQADRTTGWNILLGDGKNLNACAVEISDNYCKVYWAGDPAEDIGPYYSIPNAVRRTNSYVNPNYRCSRYEKLSQLILDNYGNITAEMSIEFLPTVGGSCQSVVFDSTDLELWVADTAYGTRASQREYIYLSYDNLFPENTHELTISSTEGGSVTAPGEGKFNYDEVTVVDLVAEAEEGYYFISWTGDVDTIANVTAATTTITMVENYSIMARFVAPGLCFIATAAYGTPMANQVQTLREFRDEYLLTNPLGQAFVNFYYKVSPPIAELITDHPGLKPMVRAGLMPAVAMSAVVINSTETEKMAILGLLVLISMAVTVWVIRRQHGGSERTQE